MGLFDNKKKMEAPKRVESNRLDSRLLKNSNYEMSDEEKRDIHQAIEGMKEIKRQIDSDPEAKALFESLGGLFGNFAKDLAGSLGTSKGKAESTQSGREAYRQGGFQAADYAKVNDIPDSFQMNGSKTEYANQYKDKEKIVEGRSGGIYAALSLEEYEPLDYELDIDPSIIAYLFSLDGAGYRESGNIQLIAEDINPTKMKQWNNKKNPFLKDPKLEAFYRKYFEIEDSDDKRYDFVEGVK